jgi:hypothetical protein
MTLKNIPASIKGQNFVISYNEENEEWLKNFCGCVIKNNTLVEPIHKRRKKQKGSRNVTKTRKQI